MSDGNTVAPTQDPREVLRGRIAEPKPVAVSLTREGDRILGRYLQVERRQTRYGERFAVILAEADISGVFDAPELAAGELVSVLLLGYLPRELKKLNPAVDEWIAISRGPKVQGADNSYTRWELHSARPDASAVNLSELADLEADSRAWQTGAFNDEPNF
jgi:hypothetical protein